MEIPGIPQDDLMDVIEMTDALETCISSVIKGNEKNLAMSALMSASVNCLLDQCETLQEVAFYRHLLVHILDNTIKRIQIKNPD